MQMGLLWLLPESFSVLIVAALGIGVMLRALSIGRALKIILAVALIPVVIDSLVNVAFDVLPWWLLALGLFVVGVQMLRFFAGFIIGNDAAAHMMGQLAAQTVIACIRLLLFPVRAAGWLIGRAIGG